MKATTSYIIDRVLHWTVALAILLMLTDMGTRIHFVDYEIKGIVQHKQDAIEVHMSIALVLFTALLARLVWTRFFLHSEHQLKIANPMRKTIVTLVHLSMYAVVIAMMVTGLLMVNNYEHSLNFYQWFSFSTETVERTTFITANEYHRLFESFIYYLIVLHIAGAIYHKR